MRKILRMKCPHCGQGNRVLVNNIFIEQSSSEPKVKVLIPLYEPLETVECEKCKRVIADPKELIRIAILQNLRNHRSFIQDLILTQ